MDIHRGDRRVRGSWWWEISSDDGLKEKVRTSGGGLIQNRGALRKLRLVVTNGGERLKMEYERLERVGWMLKRSRR